MSGIHNKRRTLIQFQFIGIWWGCIIYNCYSSDFRRVLYENTCARFRRNLYTVFDYCDVCYAIVSGVKCSSVLVLLYGRERAASTNVGSYWRGAGKSSWVQDIRIPYQASLNSRNFQIRSLRYCHSFLKDSVIPI